MENKQSNSVDSWQAASLYLEIRIKINKLLLEIEFCVHYRQKGDEYWFQYTCPKENKDTGVAYYNDLATLFFSVPHQV
jgi:hypothetical protein